MAHGGWRRVAAAFAAASLLLAGCVSTAKKSTAGKPNIVFVLTDDLAWNLVPYMPNVTRMQEDGVTFSNYFVTDSLCCPSRASILTGRYPHNTGVFTNTGRDGGLHLFRANGEEKDTFATSLQRAGYRTALLGKYLNGYEPTEADVPPGWSDWQVGGDAYSGFDYDLSSNGRVEHHGSAAGDYLTDVLASKGLSFLDRSIADDKPFLLEISTFTPHFPYPPAPRDTDAFPGLWAPRTAAYTHAVGLAGPRWLAAQPALNGAQQQSNDVSFRRRAQSMLAVDQLIGRLQDQLRRKGELEDTFFVFSSDNGYHMGEHRLTAGKMTAFDTDIKVPLIVTGPGVPPGRTVDKLVANIDLRPTFEQLGGLTPPPDVDGRSLVPFLRAEQPRSWRAGVLIEHHGPVLDRGDPDRPRRHSGNPPSYSAVRTARSLYVEYADGERELYDVAGDPDELRNLAGRLPPAARATLHALLSALAGCRGSASCSAAAPG